MVRSMSKTKRAVDKPVRKPHPKKYTDPIEDVDKFIEEELEDVED